jgi:hypothetical protein
MEMVNSKDWKKNAAKLPKSLRIGRQQDKRNNENSLCSSHLLPFIMPKPYNFLIIKDKCKTYVWYYIEDIHYRSIKIIN